MCRWKKNSPRTLPLHSISYQLRGGHVLQSSRGTSKIEFKKLSFNGYFGVFRSSKFELLVTFSDYFLDELSAQAQPTHLISIRGKIRHQISSG